MPPLNTCSVPPRPPRLQLCWDRKHRAPRWSCEQGPLKLPLLLYTRGQPQSIQSPKEVPTSFYLRKLDQTSHFSVPLIPPWHGTLLRQSLGTMTFLFPSTHELLSEVCFWSNWYLCTTTELVLTHFICFPIPHDHVSL